MMRLRRQIWRRFAKSTRGVAAVEFAMVVPVLSLLFLASFDGGRAIAVYMKVRAASYTLAAITNQYATISDTDMTGIFNATTDVLSPYATGPLALTVSGITIDASGKATVSWSSTQGGTARGVPSTITVPAKLDIANSYLVLSEVSYLYTPMFGYFGNGTAISLSDYLYVTPRSTSTIARTSP
jgi:Flp pilus assembly protein TadG